ncbi:MAG: muconolactone Delta-isomerase family protein [Solirubrobacteraceae bacterium]|jgi:muconolactone delta-isomerase
MEFLVEFVVNVPDGTAEPEVEEREGAEASAAAKLVDEGHVVRLWKLAGAAGEMRIVGLYRADSETQLNGLLGALPLSGWMDVAVTPLAPHPNDPASAPKEQTIGKPLPAPKLTHVYRLEATLGQPLDLGEVTQGHRRIVALTGGTFTGPKISGKLVPGASADWQVLLPDGTALGDIRYTLQTEGGDLLYVQSRSVRHGSAEVLGRLARGEGVDASEYTFRAATQIETAAPELDWLNKGTFISVAARGAACVIYDTYLVA